MRRAKKGPINVVADIEAKRGAIAVQGDVAKAADVKNLRRRSKQAFGRLDILVNNAGVYNLFCLSRRLRKRTFTGIFNINVLGLLLATKEAAKLFGDEGGSVINIGSVANDFNPPNSVVYTATKGAVDAVTRVLAKELGPGRIRVNAIKPGFTDTEGTRAVGHIGSDFEKQLVTQTPLGADLTAKRYSAGRGVLGVGSSRVGSPAIRWRFLAAWAKAIPSLGRRARRG